MSSIRFVCVAAFAMFASGSAAFAQTSQQQSMDRASTMDNERIARDLTNAAKPVDRKGRSLTANQVVSAAKSAVKKNGITCKVTEAALLGVTFGDSDLFEVACEGGGGYIFTNPQAMPPAECAVLAQMAVDMQADGFTPPPNSTCTLKGNLPAS